MTANTLALRSTLHLTDARPYNYAIGCCDGHGLKGRGHDGLEPLESEEHPPRFQAR